MSEARPVSALRVDEGVLTSSDGLPLWWRTYEPEAPRARVCLAHGAADHSSRHADTISHLTSLGFAVDTFDFRGHGRSGGPRGHVDRFDDYVTDLRLFVDRSRLGAGGKNLFVLGHSQGGLVVTHLALAQPEGIRGYVFSAPYFALAERPPRHKVALAHTVGRLFPRLGVPHGMEPDRLTRDVERQRATREDPFFVWTVTPRWFRESGPARAAAVARARDITAPCLFLVPLDDRVVDPRVTLAVFEAIGAADKTLHCYPDARHELFNELPATRAEFLGHLGPWLLARCA